VFTAIAFLAVVYARDKTKGIGIALLLWFYFVFIYDALVLLFLFNFSNYPLEKMLMMLTFLNPVDLTRIIMLMQLDMAAIMGYTGALFTQFLGSSTGLVWCFFALLLWIAVPFILAQRKFTRKDI
jgi:Cu-processing system permease protein